MRTITGTSTFASIVAALALLGAVMIATAPIAPASAGVWEHAGVSNGVPEAVVVVTHDGTLASWSGQARGGSVWTCGYFGLAAPVTNVLDPTPIVDWDGGPVSPTAGEWYMFGCLDGSGLRVRTSWTQFDPGDPFHGTTDTARAIDEARARLPIPDPQPAVNPPDAQLVGLPTWLWLTDPWERIWAEASIGGAWVGVAAWPTTAHWEFADGSDAWCDRGIAYDTSRRAIDQSSNCTHVFTSSSALREGGVEPVRVTVEWDVEWLSSDFGGEPLGTVTRSAEFVVKVVEAQALIR